MFVIRLLNLSLDQFIRLSLKINMYLIKKKMFIKLFNNISILKITQSHVN